MAVASGIGLPRPRLSSPAADARDFQFLAGRGNFKKNLRPAALPLGPPRGCELSPEW